VRQFELVTERNGLYDITPFAEQALADSGLRGGILLVSSPHSTAAVTLASPWDPMGLEDIHDEISRIVPTRIDFKHQHDTPQDAAGHIKAAIIGHSRSILFENGRLGVGHSQRIYFLEFDGPRRRNVQIQMVGS
jgi:secondary thiamine-phosphate synthase enzyme